MVWANDNRTLFYTTKDALDRPNKLWRSVIGDPGEDELVFHEVCGLGCEWNKRA